MDVSQVPVLRPAGVTVENAHWPDHSNGMAAEDTMA